MGRKVRLLKSNFTSGEIDPELKARTDIKHYYTGASLLDNVFPKPQGGVRRRPGLEFIYDLTSIMTGGVCRVAQFEFDVDTTYLLVFVNTKIVVVKNGAVVHTITGTPWDNTELPSINWTQSADTMIIFHRGTQPYSLVRVSDTSWTLGAITFDSIPYYDYSPASSNPAQTLTPSAVEGKIKITLGGGTVFSAASVGQKIEGNGGLARIVQYNSATEVIAVTEIPFNNTDAITSGNWTYRTGFEASWSNTRGWPVCGTFHGGRLIMGGGPRPSTIWGSRVGEYFDFEILTGLDAEAFEVTLDSDGLNSIVNLMSLRDLLVFTTGGEFVENNRPITPDNVAPVMNTRRGSEPGLRVIELEGSALFVQKEGKAIREFYFTNDYQNYTDDNLSLLASHLITGPRGMAKRRASSTQENDILGIVNVDGTARICSLVRSQEVVAWARVTSPGATFIDIGVDRSDIYWVTERTINSVTKYFLEKFNEDHLLDCSKRVTSGMPTDAMTAAHLPSTEVTVMADDSDMGEYDLDGSGQATLSRDAETYYEVGINHTPRIISLPVEPEMQEGSQLGRKKRIVDATLILQDTSYIELNGNQVTFKQFGLSGGSTPLDAPPQKFTGRKKIDSLLGYSVEAQIEITQTRPGFMDLLGIEIKISV